MSEGRSNLPGIPGSDQESLAGIPGADEQPLSGIPGAEEFRKSRGEPAGTLTATTTSVSDAAPPATAQPSGTVGLEQEPPDAKTRRRLRIELIIAIGLAVFFAFFLLGAVLDAVTPPDHRNSRATYIVLALIFVGLLVLSYEWAHRIEHRLRKHNGHPLAAAFELGSPAPLAQVAAGARGSAPPAAPASRAPANVAGDGPVLTPRDAAGIGPPPPSFTRRARLRRTRRYSPATWKVSIVMWSLLAVGFAIGSLFVRADAARSEYTQQHGILANAIVTNVDNTETCGKSSCTWSALIRVDLRPPVDGATTSVVHYPAYSDESDGDMIQVLVDPKELSYSELPGHPNTVKAAWIALASMAGLFALIAAWSVWRLVRLQRKRRELLAQAPTLSPAPAA
jgi:hypothetical protein